MTDPLAAIQAINAACDILGADQLAALASNDNRQALRVHADDYMRNDDRQAICDWLTTVGANPAIVRAAIVHPGPEGWELHLSEFVRDGNATILDRALNAPVTRPRVIQLGAAMTWPTVHTWSRK